MRNTPVAIRKCWIFCVLKVYKEILRYYKEYQEKKCPEKRESNEMERPEKKDLEKKGLQLFTLFPVKIHLKCQTY
jgi:hypothetical protein